VSGRSHEPGHSESVRPSGKWTLPAKNDKKGQARAPGIQVAAMNNHQWDKVRESETRYKEKSLRRMSQKESLGIFLGLYQFGQELLDKKYYSTFDQAKIKSLIRIHSFAKEVK